MAHYMNYLMVNNHQGNFATLDQMNIINDTLFLFQGECFSSLKVLLLCLL
jgi:hypothetical protein